MNLRQKRERLINEIAQTIIKRNYRSLQEDFSTGRGSEVDWFDTVYTLVEIVEKQLRELSKAIASDNGEDAERIYGALYDSATGLQNILNLNIRDYRSGRVYDEADMVKNLLDLVEEFYSTLSEYEQYGNGPEMETELTNICMLIVGGIKTDLSALLRSWMDPHMGYDEEMYREY